MVNSMDEKNVSLSESIKTLDKNQADPIKKLLKFCKKLNVTVTLEIDSDDPSNTGIFQEDESKIKLSPTLLKSPDELLIIFLHEIGHAEQLIKFRAEMCDKFPGIMSIPYSEYETKKWKTKTQKYWIDYVGLEQDAWTRGYDIAKKLKIQLDIEKWNKIRLSCLRRAGSWLAGTFIK